MHPKGEAVGRQGHEELAYTMMTIHYDTTRKQKVGTCWATDKKMINLTLSDEAIRNESRHK